MKIAPWARLRIPITPKISVNPVAKINKTEPNTIPFRELIIIKSICLPSFLSWSKKGLFFYIYIPIYKTPIITHPKWGLMKQNLIRPHWD